MRIGAHVSISGGLAKAVERANNIGANTIQIFSSPPRNWKTNTYSDQEMDDFKQELKRFSISPVFIHAIYLINLASPNPFLYQKSIDTLILDMQFAEKIGAEGVIIHIGSHLGEGLEKVIGRTVTAIETILDKSSKGMHRLVRPYFIVENSAGSKGKIGSKFEDIGKILEKVSDSRMKVCLDTAHAFASGYPVNTREGLEKTIKEFQQTVGLENLIAIHANDSKVPLGKGVDRHENIGKGFLGKEAFKYWLNHPKLKNLPFILETPGFKNEGPDKDNIQILQSLVE